ncbi:7-cyano-7-deazaguanine synthase [Lutibacter sp. A64]|uniref:7-cyano-7-deazaguanine synthase n=1 Tax=Lutibacter sp. A64 TaxID=2918526 RepID=UPI001F06F173|nr:7-cyano-7-deazaguanine synthase [Lutibacter sp. A64]UMB53936.1 7-cyano-7-deazaguanine synthase [Lutibacter sp. A64]
MESIKKSILLSGGIDSICLAYHLKPEVAYTIDYGQNSAEREIYVSKLICHILKIRHEVIRVNCKSLGSGNLINENSIEESPSEEWWPYRNQLLITLCLMKAINDKVGEIHLASVKSDSFHKDGTEEFYKMCNDLSMYQEGGIKIISNTVKYFSHELAVQYNVPKELILLAHSCHMSNIACGKCSGCLKQMRVRQELNIE